MVSGTRDLFRPESIYFLLIFLFSFLRVSLLFLALGSGSDGERLSGYYLVRVPGSAYVLYGVICICTTEQISSFCQMRRTLF